MTKNPLNFCGKKQLSQLVIQALLPEIMGFYFQMKQLGKWEDERNMFIKYWREFQLEEEVLYMRTWDRTVF